MNIQASIPLFTDIQGPSLHEGTSQKIKICSKNYWLKMCLYVLHINKCWCKYKPNGSTVKKVPTERTKTRELGYKWELKKLAHIKTRNLCNFHRKWVRNKLFYRYVCSCAFKVQSSRLLISSKNPFIVVRNCTLCRYVPFHYDFLLF